MNNNNSNETNSFSNIQVHRMLWFLFSVFINFNSFKFISVKSKEHQMDLFQQYTTDDLSSYTQSIIDWKTMFQYLQDYRIKAIEQSRFYVIFMRLFMYWLWKRSVWTTALDGNLSTETFENVSRKSYEIDLSIEWMVFILEEKINKWTNN